MSILVAIHVALPLPASAQSNNITLRNVPTTVCFSPYGRCADKIIHEINAAKKEVLVMAYCFTSVRIAKALVDAKKRGVRVEVIIDKGRKTERYSAVTFFKNQGIPVYIDDLEPLQHNKIMIIDVSTVITGSFNFTKAAERNAENVLIIRSKEMAGIYKRNWERHLNHSW